MRVKIETKQFGPASRKNSGWAKTGTSGESPEVLFFKEGKVLCRQESYKKHCQPNRKLAERGRPA